MITGAHWLMYSKDADADRTFLRDVLNLRAVDAGGGWLIFGLPPGELAVHPGSGDFTQMHADHPLLGAVLYLMCDDLAATMKEYSAKGVQFAETTQARWGTSTSFRLPSGGEVGLYQPAHPTALNI